MRNSTSNPRELAISDLQTLLDAEPILARAFGVLGRAAYHARLKSFCRQGVTYTDRRVERIREALNLLGASEKPRRTAGYPGLIKDALVASRRWGKDRVMRDCAILATVERISHHGLAAYTSIDRYLRNCPRDKGAQLSGAEHEGKTRGDRGSKPTVSAQSARASAQSTGVTMVGEAATSLGGALFDLPTFGPGGSVNVVIEAAKGTSAKCKFDRSLGAFLYSRPLPRGLVYPFDWGFIPSTCAEDGDPLDAMVIHSEACPVGTVIRCRPAAVLQVQQTQQGKGTRNDRLLLSPIEIPSGEASLLTRETKLELEQFFKAAVLGRGKMLRYKGWAGARTARATVKRATSLYQEKFS